MKPTTKQITTITLVTLAAMIIVGCEPRGPLYCTQA